MKLIDYSEHDFVEWQAERERLLKEIKELREIRRMLLQNSIDTRVKYQMLAEGVEQYVADMREDFEYFEELLEEVKNGPRE